MAATSTSCARVVVYPSALELYVLLGLSIESRETQPDDALLLARIADQGDENALEELYDRHSLAVYSVLMRVTRDRASAEELCQEVFLRLWRNAGQFDGRATQVQCSA